MWGGPTGGNPWTPPPPTLQQQQQVPQEAWSFNPNHYTDIPNNQVDWAALAQQWMILKEANTDSSGPPPGPPGVNLHHHHHQHHPPPPHPRHNMMPNIHQPPPPMSMGNMNFQPQVTQGMHMGGGGGRVHPGMQMKMMNSHIQVGGGDIIGEAPMDVEPLEHPDTFNKNGNWGGKQTNWFAPENNNPWSSSGSMTTNSASPNNSSGYATPTQQQGVPPHIRNTIPNSNKHQPPPAASAGGFQNFPAYQDKVAVTNQTGYETAPYVHKGGYWSTNDNSGDGAGLSHYASAATTGVSVSGYSSDENSMSDFDAAKRKALPAWIREGLEKMEREKKKKEEMIKLEAEKEEMRKRRLAEEQDKLAEDDQQSVTESKWANSHGPSSDEEDNELVDEKKPNPVKELTLAELASRLSKDDIEQAIMLGIRRASTYILKTVTDAEINQAANEAIARAKRKKAISTTMQVRKLGALASLTRGPLGLTGYGSDSDDSDASKSDSEDEKKEDEPDSEEELIAEIERKKRLWDLQRLEEERMERSRSRSRSRGPSPHQDDENKISSTQEIESHQSNSHVRDKREVEKPNVTNATSGSIEKSIEGLNGRRGSTDSNSRSSRRDSDAKKEKSNSIKKEESGENSYKKREKSRSKSPRKDRKRRSESKESRRHRSRSSSRHRSKRSRSRSSSRHRRRRSRSRSSNRRRRDRSSSRNRKQHRSRSKSESRDRHCKSSRNSKRSRSRDRKRSKSIDKSKNNSKEDKSDKIKSKSKSDSSLKEKDKQKSKKRSSKSRSQSVSSQESSSKRVKSRKKKHKKRSARSHSRSRSLSSSRSRTSAKVTKR